jgi:hypothetical protein
MENIFETLGGILRPEQIKKEFSIVETTAEHSLAYNRATRGRAIVGRVTAASAEEALEEWFADKALVYGISRVVEKYHSGFVKDSDPERYIWQDGDTSAEFGDYTVSVEAV